MFASRMSNLSEASTSEIPSSPLDRHWLVSALRRAGPNYRTWTESVHRHAARQVASAVAPRPRTSANPWPAPSSSASPPTACATCMLPGLPHLPITPLLPTPQCRRLNTFTTNQASTRPRDLYHLRRVPSSVDVIQTHHHAPLVTTPPYLSVPIGT